RVSKENRAAAREGARKSIVLLKNDAQLLPLGAARRILVTGPLADAPGDLLGPWHARGEAADGVSVLNALRARATAAKNGTTIDFAEGVALDERGNGTGDDAARISAAVARARDSDLVIAVLGERERQSGEANNRAHLDLPGAQQALVDALAGTRKPIVVVFLRGRALAVPELVKDSGALLHAFFPGIEGGHAIADVLFGDYNPGGKQPLTCPRSVGQLPITHHDTPTRR